MNESNKYLDALLISTSRVLIDNEAKEVSLCDVSAADFPNKLDQKMTRKIKSYERGRKYTSFIKSIKSAAAIFTAICTVVLFLCLSVYGVRGDLWNLIVDLTDSRFIICVDTNVDAPEDIKEFKEPSIYPDHLIKKIMWQEFNLQMIYYFENEENNNFEYILAFTQYPVPSNNRKIIESSEKFEVIDVTVNDLEAKLLVHNSGKFSIIWHDAEYVYTLSCMDESVDVYYLIEMAESVK